MRYIIALLLLLHFSSYCLASDTNHNFKDVCSGLYLTINFGSEDTLRGVLEEIEKDQHFFDNPQSFNRLSEYVRESGNHIVYHRISHQRTATVEFWRGLHETALKQFVLLHQYGLAKLYHVTSYDIAREHSAFTHALYA